MTNTNVNLNIIFAMHVAIGASELDVENGALDIWSNVYCQSMIDPNHVKGYSEFYVQLASYIPKLIEEWDIITQKEDFQKEDYYINFLIEVVENFGYWFGQYIIYNRKIPTEYEVEEVISNLVENMSENTFLQLTQTFVDEIVNIAAPVENHDVNILTLNNMETPKYIN